MIKRQRQQEILRIVRAARIHTQDQLAEALAKVGIETTQVTLSRDIRELGLVKTAQGYQELDVAPAAPDARDVVGEFVSEVRVAGNLVVLKTSPGAASPVAVALDASNWPEIVGTIAGDDTVLVITPDEAAAAVFQQKIS
ncbi:MAG: ArgR family transcriptional regulator [Bryobacterales bacterium]|nr:ArgR family transcriptional regulator [Bryobacterales bacterium]